MDISLYFLLYLFLYFHYLFSTFTPSFSAFLKSQVSAILFIADLSTTLPDILFDDFC